jgi:hypothetical protein
LAAHDGFSHRRRFGPSWPVLKQIENRRAEIVIGRQQAIALGDNPMPVMVGVAGEREIKLILHANQSLHRIRRRRVHANLAVPIHRHETESGSTTSLTTVSPNSCTLRDPLPVMDAGTAEGINAQMKFCAANDVHINHVAKVVDVGGE